MEAHGLAPDKKNATRLGAYLVFVDESGFLLIPPVRRTWAPRGQTPVVRHHQKRDRISVISGLSISPQRKHLGLYYWLHTKNIQHEEVCLFLRHLLQHLRGHIIVVWDNGTIHKGPAMRDFCRTHRRIHLERLPAYAPELDPDEGVWSQAKDKLANGRPDTLSELWCHLLHSLDGIKLSQSKLRACVHQSDLPPFLP
jgi:transposase